ncbi:hypothetical protein B0H17DRAFT_1150537 [Mycena rosella]|uniref:No apical meristem-associated C-terminal domain-containing protein n=1 Tax=Mycena rosella TaxID=1033263 RepID=A0AAD7BSM1_MYCRO|nr:hypothetical protein B0H17DRAFT_1150537 [Mycena rosella]
MCVIAAESAELQILDYQGTSSGPATAAAQNGTYQEAQAHDSKPPAKKTKPQPATSVPATPTIGALAKKPLNAKDPFSATVLAEEETAQQALQVKTDRNKDHKEVALARIEAELSVRRARAEGKKEEATKLELVRLKMEQEHQYRMVQLKVQQDKAGPSSFSGSNSSSLHGSPFPSDSFF